jgi:hypothetical protein
VLVDVPSAGTLRLFAGKDAAPAEGAAIGVHIARGLFFKDGEPVEIESEGRPAVVRTGALQP